MPVLKKIKTKKGETIAETLVATLIAALSMVMFASMVMASRTIVEESNKKVMEYYEGYSQVISTKEVRGTPMGDITLYSYKSGVMSYDYNSTGSSGDSGDSGDSGEGT